MADSRAPKDLFNWWLTTGLSRWATTPTPYRSLRAELVQHMSLKKASGLAAELFKAHFGYWPGDKRHTGRDHRSH